MIRVQIDRGDGPEWVTLDELRDMMFDSVPAEMVVVAHETWDGHEMVPDYGGGHATETA